MLPAAWTTLPATLAAWKVDSSGSVGLQAKIRASGVFTVSFCLGEAELVNMKSGRQSKACNDPSKRKKSKKDDTSAQEISVERKAAKGLRCRKSGSSVGKVSKQTTGNDNGYSQLPPTPLHAQSPWVSISTLNTPVRVQSSVHNQKFQLQLFPMDEPTRKRLEKENHCPYLELTITTKKKIASVIRHLYMKWGNSKSASEVLFLFPYNVHVESLESYIRWSLKDSDITAAEVHAAIGKPAVFRLRYCWLSFLEPKIGNSSHAHLNLANAELLLKQDVLETDPMKPSQAADNLRPDVDAKLSWVDCVSNMSFGALLSEAEEADGAKLYSQAPQKQISKSCDSFDAAIAAHILKYKTGNQSATIAQPSILDAEETCNPFSFRTFALSNENRSVQSQATPINTTIENAQHHGVKLCNVSDPPVEKLNSILASEEDAQPIQEEKEENLVDPNATNNVVYSQFEGLDMHWPPSVGSWQFVVAASSQQIISSDSNGPSGFASANLDIF